MKLVALVCLCLVTRCGITAAGVNGPEVVKVFAALGSDVILPCSLSTKENIQSKVFDWKRDGPKDREVFLYDAGIHYNNGRSGQSQTFKGRVFHFPDQLKNGIASITIRNTEMTDSGNYSCHFPRLQPPQTFYVELIVYRVLKDRTGENITGAAPKPSVTQLEQTKDWSRLQCVVRGASPKPKVEWQDSDGNILPAEKPQVSERRGSYDVILQVKVNKTDNYSCVVTQETISHQTYTEIHVYNSDRVLKDRTGENTGAAPEPHVTQLEQTKYWSRLQCEVHGNPEPKVEWKDSKGNILPAGKPQVSKSGDRYDVILNATVTKTNRYRCVATQKTIGHQIYKETHVYISESSTGWIVAAVLCAFFVGVLIGGGVLVAKRHITLNCIKGSSPGSTSGAPPVPTSVAPSASPLETRVLLKKEEPVPIQSELQDDL